jgi:hypothetical protein
MAAACLAAALRPAAEAQGPPADWQTLTTAHFRVHYPAPFAAWAGRAAASLETLRERAIAEIGYAPGDVADVVVSDPVADANGEALPFRGWPRLVLWTTPPPPDSEIGYYRDWTEDLLVHEEAHLVHLLRPSRAPLLAALSPVGGVTVTAPRWVIEGYATLIEGRLTGAGRPNGDLRAAILRRWAQAGRLPGYERLASDSHSWRGMSMAYLAGSAFLEWLEQRAGPGSLRKLWARMTARSGRGFDEAFSGIWGNSPASLYDRFRAELTYRAMEAEKRVQAVGPLTVREGPLWQELSWTTGAPAVSPDGTRLALVRRFRDRPAELVIWSTAPDTAAETKWQQEQARLQARDPQDVPAVRSKPLPRKPLYSWGAADGGEPAMPRFLPDGRSLLMVRFLPDGQGYLHPDLFSWRPESGEVRRLTRQADLRDPDPAPDGTWAVAVRDRYGLSQLVTVDLAGGEVRALTPPSLDRVYDRPRISPDGRRVAFGLHEGGGWKLALLDLAPGRTAGAMVSLEPPAGGTASSPAWSADGRTLYGVVGRGGFVDLYAFTPAAAAAPAPDAAAPGVAVTSSAAVSGNTAAESAPALGNAVPIPVAQVAAASRALTRTQGAAFAPAPTPDGKGIFYLSLEATGLDLHRLDLSAPHPQLAEVDAPAAQLAPAVRPIPPSPIPPPAAGPVGALAASLPAAGPAPTLPASTPYGAGRQELLPLLGGAAGSAGDALTLGLRSGDLIGRLDVLALGAFGSPGATRGGTLAGTWRGWPIDVGLQLFDTTEQPSRQGVPVPHAAAALDLERRGAAATAEWNDQAPGRRLRLRGSLLWQRFEPAGAAEAPDLGPMELQLAPQAPLPTPATPQLAAAVPPPAPGATRPAPAALLIRPPAPRFAPATALSAPASAPFAPSAAVAAAAAEEVAAFDGSYRLARRFGLWRLDSAAGVRLAGGITGGGGDGWSRYGGDLGLAVAHDKTRLDLRWRRDGSRQVTRVFDLYQLGGTDGGLLPPAALAPRILSPALPAAALLGAEHEEERAELSMGFLPLPLFYERHRLWGGALPQPAQVTLAGFEYRLAMAPYPLVRLPAIELRLGAARIFSDPLGERNRWWLFTVFRP